VSQATPNLEYSRLTQFDTPNTLIVVAALTRPSTHTARLNTQHAWKHEELDEGKRQCDLDETKDDYQLDVDEYDDDHDDYDCSEDTRSPTGNRGGFGHADVTTF
jgi:hypothetical protein